MRLACLTHFASILQVRQAASPRYGANVNAQTDNGATVLMVAAKGGHLETVQLLLQWHADPKVKNQAGGTANKWALENGNTDIVGLLKAAGETE